MEDMEKRLEQLRNKVKSDIEQNKDDTVDVVNVKDEMSVTMPLKQLEDLIFRQSKSANDQLYKGLVKKHFDISDKLNYIEKLLEEFILDGGKK